MFPVTGSTSTNTGIARSYRMQFADATNEKGVVITRSPASTPAAITARCRPAVPLDTPMPRRAPAKRATRRSNSSN
jgi:hypothetical protein